MASPSEQVEAKAALSVDEVARLLGVSPHSVYEACARRQLPSIRLGRRILIPREALQRMLAKPRR